MILCWFFHESCQFYSLRFLKDWNQRFFDSEFFFNKLEPMVLAFPFFRTGGSFKFSKKRLTPVFTQ